MNILNENEAIVINSLENWEKVAEILDKAGYDFADSPVSELVVSEFDISFYLRVHKGKSLGWGSLHFLKKEYSHYTSIQDTEFIAKHSLDKLKSEFDNRTIEEKLKDILNQDKNMKIKVLKENGLLEVGKEYKLTLSKDGEYYFTLTLNRYFVWQVGEWLANGYIEEAKEVSYRFEDIVRIQRLDSDVKTFTATTKQAEQVEAFAKLTHVRAKILKDAGYSEDWEAKEGDIVFETIYDSASGEFITENYTVGRDYTVGLCLDFPLKKLANLAFEQNKELFKTYLGV